MYHLCDSSIRQRINKSFNFAHVSHCFWPKEGSMLPLRWARLSALIRFFHSFRHSFENIIPRASTESLPCCFSMCTIALFFCFSSSLHRLEHVVTSSQHLSHFLRHLNLSLQTWQILEFWYLLASTIFSLSDIVYQPQNSTASKTKLNSVHKNS